MTSFLARASYMRHLEQETRVESAKPSMSRSLQPGSISNSRPTHLYTSRTWRGCFPGHVDGHDGPGLGASTTSTVQSGYKVFTLPHPSLKVCPTFSVTNFLAQLSYRRHSEHTSGKESGALKAGTADAAAAVPTTVATTSTTTRGVMVQRRAVERGKGAEGGGGR